MKIIIKEFAFYKAYCFEWKTRSYFHRLGFVSKFYRWIFVGTSIESYRGKENILIIRFLWFTYNRKLKPVSF